MKKRPWLKFYAQDWLSDPHLRACSAADRGVLADMMALAHNGRPYGYITNGDTKLTEADLQKALSLPYQTFRKALASLEHRGRIRRAYHEHDATMPLALDGVWYIPRMVRDGLQSAKAQELGRQGGNPALVKTLNPPVKAGVKPRSDQIRSEEETPFPPCPGNVKKSKPKGGAALHDDSVRNTAIPGVLKTVEFIEAWASWNAHRRETKKYQTPTSIKLQLQSCAKIGPARAVAAIKHSIAASYQGIFEPSKPEKPSGKAGANW